jgi:S-adenosylmethionine-diacylglycerol 3-amino-3-carboxypropyl transferase
MLKFAVVREDPGLELALARAGGARRVLTVASGGCTALALKHALPEVEVHAFDLNPDQLAHCRAKAVAIAEGRLAELNVGDARPDGLSQRGEFEKLFRVLRSALTELVMPASELEAFFARPDPALLARWIRSPYWPAAFEVAFAEGLLHAMFGPDATRHAPRGSYPGYFQRVFERGLARDDAAKNPWLQHVLLQRYVDAPAFLRAGRALEVEWHQGTLPQVPGLERFDVVSLSNVFDWSDESLVAEWAGALQGLAPGSLVAWRQLNNQRDWKPIFGAGFAEDAALSTEWTRRERALFYERVTVVRRR